MRSKTLVALITGLAVAAGLAISPVAAAAPPATSAAASLAASSPGASAGAFAGVTEAAQAGMLLAKKKKRYRPAKGAIFNNPMGGWPAKLRIERHIIQAIKHTKKGSRIRVAAYSFDRGPVADALIAARKRGVKIQMLFNDHLAPRAQGRVQKVLGRKTSKANFLKRCVAGCRAQKTDYNNLHSKFYLFSKTGKARNVVMVGSHNLTMNAVRWQWNDLWTGRGKTLLYQKFVTLFNDMRKDYSVRQPYYTFCSGSGSCNESKSKHFVHVFPKPSTASNDVVLDILNGVQCLYKSKGKTKRTVLRLSMHTMRGKRGDYLSEKIRSMYAAGCDFKVQYGLMGFYTKQKIGAVTRRGRIPLRSTGFDLDPLIDEDPVDEVERYTHQKYLVVRGSFRGNKDTNMVFTGSSNWASLGTPQDEIIFTIRGRHVVNSYLKNWNFMWRPPHSRNAYTTTLSNYRTFRAINGVRVPVIAQRPVTTIEPDGYVGAGPTWEGD